VERDVRRWSSIVGIALANAVVAVVNYFLDPGDISFAGAVFVLLGTMVVIVVERPQ
jgi:hypothetical protein